MKEKLLKLRDTKLSEYQKQLIEAALKTLENGRELSHNTILFIERMYAKRFRK